MDQIKIGKFIADERKTKKYRQKGKEKKFLAKNLEYWIIKQLFVEMEPLTIKNKEKTEKFAWNHLDSRIYYSSFRNGKAKSEAPRRRK